MKKRILTQIQLVDNSEDEHRIVAASLIENVTLSEVRLADRGWRESMVELMAKADRLGVPNMQRPEHLHWRWQEKMLRADRSTVFYGIECQGRMQALMAVRPETKSFIAPGEAMVYVDFLATAPWNLPAVLLIGGRPQYNGCGSLLMVAAIRLSSRLGYNLRVGLHSLDGASGYYRDHCRMTDLGVDRAYQDLRRFEFLPEQAEIFKERVKMELKVSPEYLIELAESGINEPTGYITNGERVELTRRRREYVVKKIAALEEIEITDDMHYITAADRVDVRRANRIIRRRKEALRDAQKGAPPAPKPNITAGSK